MLIQIIFLQELSQGLIQQSTLTSSQSCSHSNDSFFNQKKKKINLKKKISIFKRKILHFSKEKSPKPYSKRKISNEQILNKNFQITSKDQDFLIFQKKKSIKIFNSLKKFKISKFFKKKKIKIFNSFEIFKFFKFKKKKSSLNSSLGTESYDPLPYFPVVQHQVNCPPSAFIGAWNMSQTRGIRWVCQSLFNE